MNIKIYPSIFAILSVGFLLIEQNKGLMFSIFLREAYRLKRTVVNKTDLQASYLSGTYCHKTGTRPPSCPTPREPTI